MCDTMVVTGEMASDGVTIFGKNSDREPNEAQYIALYPAANYPPEASLHCTYIDVPQVEHTHAVLLSKPFWIWGAEMGANEHGLVIGNEALFSKVPVPKEKALLGMDLLRLGLERATTAQQAVEVITSLLEQFGQGGPAGYTHPLYYHNSFLMADPKEAWILETIERHWAARQVRGASSISNCLTLGSQFDLVSKNLVSYAQIKGLTKKGKDFDFARDYSDFFYTTFCKGRQRCRRSQDLLKTKSKADGLFAMFATMRDHGEKEDGRFKPNGSIFDFPICAHASFGPVRGSQTTGSMVAYLNPKQPLYFLTGTSAPCTSVFKPVWLDAGMPDLSPQPGGTFDPSTLFWQHEQLHRATLQDYTPRWESYHQQRDEMEASFVRQAVELTHSSTREERLAFSSRCFAEASAAEREWLDIVLKIPPRAQTNLFFNYAWKQFNQQAKIEDKIG
jgi:secernin